MKPKERRCRQIIIICCGGISADTFARRFRPDVTKQSILVRGYPRALSFRVSRTFRILGSPMVAVSIRGAALMFSLWSRANLANVYVPASRSLVS
jgi:hypothetical protein